MDWNIKASKFYSEIMNGLAGFFGLNAEDTTEAELHQKLTEAGTLEDIRATALQEATAAVQQQMSDFTAQLADLKSKFDELKADGDAKDVKLAELQGSVTDLQGQVSEKEAAIATHLETIRSLSGEVASLKAGRPLEKTTEVDESLPINGGATRAKTGNVITFADLKTAMKN